MATSQYTVLLTGASRGIGLHLTKHLLLGGKTVYATCRDPSNAKSLQQLKEEYSEKLIIEALTVNDEESIKTLVEKLRNNNRTFNVLINNAGIYSTMQKETLLNSTKSSMLGTFEVNCVAPMLITQHLYNAKLLEKNALIVNISSIMGSIQGTTQAKRGVSYCCSKAALNMFTKMVSIELPNVCSISVHPGWVITGKCVLNILLNNNNNN